MTPREFDEQALSRACLGNREAMDFLNVWRAYVHSIDDIEDTETDSEFRLGTFIGAMELYTHPFFRKHEERLKQIVLNCTNAYADTVRWEKSKVEWQRNFADHYRHFGAEMVLAVASILGGYRHMRACSIELREICWREHHNENGEAI